MVHNRWWNGNFVVAVEKRIRGGNEIPWWKTYSTDAPCSDRVYTYEYERVVRSKGTFNKPDYNALKVGLSLENPWGRRQNAQHVSIGVTPHGRLRTTIRS